MSRATTVPTPVVFSSTSNVDDDEKEGAALAAPMGVADISPLASPLPKLFTARSWKVYSVSFSSGETVKLSSLLSDGALLGIEVQDP